MLRIIRPAYLPLSESMLAPTNRCRHHLPIGAYAEKLLSNLPKGAKLRPDLEAKAGCSMPVAMPGRKPGRPPLNRQPAVAQGSPRPGVWKCCWEILSATTSEGGFRYKKRFEAFGG